MVPEHQRGHGALYGALDRGSIDVERLRTRLAGLPLPLLEGGRLALAVDVSPWLGSDASRSADRLVLSRLRPGEVRRPVHPGLAVLALLVSYESACSSAWRAPVSTGE
ncbi:transposase [Streptomyces sp. NPDC057375]|uniref:transposase n=1 Tax=Streptomyces sp. NPDC057375 TaxID=3346109 RepID=UPI003639EC2D